MAQDYEGNVSVPDDRLTRVGVARFYEISVTSVRRLEGVHLHPVQDDRGVWRFERAEVERVRSSVVRKRTKRTRPRRSRAGDIAARVFRMLDSGQDLVEIVVATRQPPTLIRDLYREWNLDLKQGEVDAQARARNAEQAHARRIERIAETEDARTQIEWIKTFRGAP